MLYGHDQRMILEKSMDFLSLTGVNVPALKAYNEWKPLAVQPTGLLEFDSFVSTMESN